MQGNVTWKIIKIHNGQKLALKRMELLVGVGHDAICQNVQVCAACLYIMVHLPLGLPSSSKALSYVLLPSPGSFFVQPLMM